MDGNAILGRSSLRSTNSGSSRRAESDALDTAGKRPLILAENDLSIHSTFEFLFSELLELFSSLHTSVSEVSAWLPATSVVACRKSAGWIRVISFVDDVKERIFREEGGSFCGTVKRHSV